MVIGWIGLGGMGRPMAGNVARGGVELIVYDTRAEPVGELVELGATAADSAAAVAEASDIVFVSLPYESVSRSVAADVFAVDNRPGVYAELSTLSPAVMQDLAVQATDAGVVFCDAPVSGSVRKRWDATLSVMVGGPVDGFETIRPTLELFGENIFHLGEVGAGSVAKIANNLIALTSMVTAMEGLLLGKRNGVGLPLLRDVIMTASGSGPQVLGVAHQHETRRYRESTTPQAALRLAVKDLALGVALAADCGLEVATAEAALGQWKAAEAAGLAEEEIWALLDHLDRQ